MNIEFGVDYYPEHWPRSRWETDARMMREMGIQVVRMAEFSWFRMEPEEGHFCFDWLEEAIDVLAREGIRTILGTPTAAPPAWICEKNPEIQPIDRWQQRRYFGGRHHDCQSNPIYRAHIRRFVTAFAERFAKNDNVIGWQIDNELGNSHQDLCMCPSCEARFRTWLEKKYGRIETLNEKWGTAFWSQGYQRFEQIHAPRPTATGENPSAMLDWKRFHSDLILEFHDFQAQILRAAAPEKFITHNMMGFSETVNYYGLGKQLDFAAHDQYPSGHFLPEQSKLRANSCAAELDFIRGVKGESFWIMEQQSSITGWEIMGRAPRPGQLALWAAQSIAHGADTIVFFRWRSCAMGTEQYWHGLLPHSGMPGRNTREIGAMMKKFAPLLREIKGGVPRAQVAILRSYDQEYAIDIQPHHPKLRYIQHLMTYYTALFERNVPVDFISEEADLARYDVIIAPLQFLMTPQLAQRYTDFVRSGGTLVLDIRAGVKDEYNLCYTDGPLPGLLGELAGVRIEEYEALREVQVNVSWDEKTYTGEKWSDLLIPTTARTLAVYASEYYAGVPAVTVNEYGSGHVYYVGTQMSAPLADRFTQELMERTGIRSLGDTPHGVEIAHRVKADKTYYFVLNHLDEPYDFAPPPAWQPYFAAQTDTIAPYGVNVYVE